MEPRPDKDKTDRPQPDPEIGDPGQGEDHFVAETGDSMSEEPLGAAKPLERRRPLLSPNTPGTISSGSAPWDWPSWES